MSKSLMELEGPQITLQYGAYALHAGLARLYARTRMHTPTRSDIRTHARASTQIYFVFCFFTEKMIPERDQVLRYTYIVCLV
jgi:hypothetical protein